MKKYHYPEALASLLVVGLGQILEGQSLKGILLLLVFYFVLPMTTYAALIISGYLFLGVFGCAVIFGSILWGYNIWDSLVRP